ncbi:hypothetical protein A9Q86_02245 [Flavobacteriales bacterium 33_180_T64]|nr:hypothetical protein A9Q86_02245 [Flavobacteriales bacterium 33_180_T64]
MILIPVTETEQINYLFKRLNQIDNKIQSSRKNRKYKHSLMRQYEFCNNELNDLLPLQHAI